MRISKIPPISSTKEKAPTNIVSASLEYKFLLLSLLNLHGEATTYGHLHLELVAALHLVALLEEVATNLIGIGAVDKLCNHEVALAQE